VPLGRTGRRLLAPQRTGNKNPLQRLSAIRANAVAAKEVTSQIKTAIPTDFPSFGAPWLMSGLASLYGRSRLANVIPPLANVAISNVPGSPVLRGALAELLAAVRALPGRQEKAVEVPKKVIAAVAKRKPAGARAPAARSAKAKRPKLRVVAG
jgi:uncharacterized protein DUF1298